MFENQIAEQTCRRHVPTFGIAQILCVSLVFEEEFVALAVDDDGVLAVNLLGKNVF